MAMGRVIRSDGLRGYAFVARERGGEDVFPQVNDLRIPESSARSRPAAEFEAGNGESGPNARERPRVRAAELTDRRTR